MVYFIPAHSVCLRAVSGGGGWVWVEGVGASSLVFHWVLYSPHRVKERREGVPVVGHNRRKPARGIPQAALTHRLEVSGATLSPTAALHRLLCSSNEFSHFYILLWHNWAFQWPQDFQPTCIINDTCISSENDHLILDFRGWYRYKEVKNFWYRDNSQYAHIFFSMIIKMWFSNTRGKDIQQLNNRLNAL